MVMCWTTQDYHTATRLKLPITMQQRAMMLLLLQNRAGLAAAHRMAGSGPACTMSVLHQGQAPLAQGQG
eukprot:1139037-Pelagomonas_calceolata.AAC.2